MVMRQFQLTPSADATLAGSYRGIQPGNGAGANAKWNFLRDASLTAADRGLHRREAPRLDA